jgi:hypothetical protein
VSERVANSKVLIVSFYQNFQLGSASGFFASVIHKLCTLRNLAFYCDCNAKPLQFVGTDQFRAAMQQSMCLDSNVPQLPSHDYLVSPLCAGLKVALNRDKSDLQVPRVHLKFEFDNVTVALHEGQFHNLLLLSDTFAREERGLRYRRLRPKESSFNVRTWWRFVIGSALQDVRGTKKVGCPITCASCSFLPVRRQSPGNPSSALARTPSSMCAFGTSPRRAWPSTTRTRSCSRRSSPAMTTRRSFSSASWERPYGR